MKKRFTDQQIVRIVGESRAIGAPAAAKKHGGVDAQAVRVAAQVRRA